MKDENPIHELYQTYIRGEASRDALEGGIFRFIRDHPWRFKLGRWDPEDREEFIADLYPAIKKAIDRYQDRGATFDAYFGTIVRWSSISYRIKRKEERAMEAAYWNQRVAETANDPEAEYRAEYRDEDYRGDEEPRRPDPAKKRRQVLALTLKCCVHVSDDFCERIAAKLSLDAVYLKQKMDAARALVAQRVKRYDDLEERAAAQFYRSLVLKARIAASVEGSARKEKYQRSLAIARRRIGLYREEAARIRLEASNKEVAEVLGVPKGTIDASIFFLKRSCTPLHTVGDPCLC